MQDGAEIGAKVNKHGAKSLETRSTSDNFHYDNPDPWRVPGVARELIYLQRARLNELKADPSRLSPAPELCSGCGRNLTALGDYRDYVHYIPGTQHQCLSPSNAPQASLTPTRGIQDDDC